MAKWNVKCYKDGVLVTSVTDELLEAALDCILDEVYEAEHGEIEHHDRYAEEMGSRRHG